MGDRGRPLGCPGGRVRMRRALRNRRRRSERSETATGVRRLVRARRAEVRRRRGRHGWAEVCRRRREGGRRRHYYDRLWHGRDGRDDGDDRGPVTKTGSPTYDVLVVGGGPAGAAT